MSGFLSFSPSFLLILDQTFEAQDLLVVGLLIVLEGILSIDNALVLGLLAKRLPRYLQGRALTYGLVGAFVFRLIAIATASLLLKWRVVKLLGGGYLVYVALKHIFFDKADEGAAKIKVDAHGHPVVPDLPGGADPVLVHPHGKPHKVHAWEFWSAVLVIEMTDIAFAIDSIMAAIALVAGGVIPKVGFHPKLWAIVMGGFLGVILMRFAAMFFIRLLERFPRFEMAAYLLVLVIGGKLLLDWAFNNKPDDAGQMWHAPLDFHSPQAMAFWVFWIAMALSFLTGFLPPRKRSSPQTS